MHPLLTSTLAVAVAEIGDKTQLLSLVLAARYKRPGPILAGMAVATVLNHALAGAVGAQIAALLGPVALRWGLGLGFFAMAAWTLVPDRLDDEKPRSGGAFWVTLVSFFFAEMGDKTQIATVGLAAAHPGASTWVVAGTTLGLLLANAPVVFLGDRLSGRLDLSKARFFAAALFALFGGWIVAFGIGG
jgi:putative Ca2+/H+ antiporter (TMEM165/GDT1 family)